MHWTRRYHSCLQALIYVGKITATHWRREASFRHSKSNNQISTTIIIKNKVSCTFSGRYRSPDGPNVYTIWGICRQSCMRLYIYIWSFSSYTHRNLSFTQLGALAFNINVIPSLSEENGYLEQWFSTAGSGPKSEVGVFV